uniref:G_PROTEIN_RECEP_F1_2 domain-containing protein n=1 Tax=Caenorhabditis tropicalis TaxID=1561998 RepID=A0A1I7TIZ1_9PELO
MEEIPLETIVSAILEGSTSAVSSITSSTAAAEVYADYEECYNDPMFTIFTYTVDDMLLAASMAATVFNVMVIFCAIKLFKRSGDTMHLFILNMTIGDLVLTSEFLNCFLTVVSKRSLYNLVLSTITC